MTTNHSDVVSMLSIETGLTKVQCDVVLTALAHVIRDAAIQREAVRLRSIGTFRTVDRAARTGRGPKTRQPVPIPARTALTFKATKALRDI